MIVSSETKIGAIIKKNPLAIEVLASISPHFNKLRNPLLRKILAPRVTVAEAAKIGNCSVDLILNNLVNIGFEINYTQDLNAASEVLIKPDENNNNIHYDAAVDVREQLSKGTDPFNLIMKNLDGISIGQTLLLINSFEPFPLIRILKEKGYKISVSRKQPDLVYTYITKIGEEKSLESKVDAPIYNEQLFQKVYQQYKDKFIEIDVREMEMPQPMITILNCLEQLSTGKVLYVHHKKIPMFLLPELKEKKFEYVIKQNGEEVLMIISPAL